MRFLIILLLSLLSAAAQTHLYFNAADFNAFPEANRTVTLQRLQPFPGNVIEYSTGSGGYFFVSNILVGDYAGMIKSRGVSSAISFQLTITSTNLGVVGANTNTSISGVQTYPTAGRTAWSIDAADSRYARAGNLTGLTNNSGLPGVINGAGLGTNISSLATLVQLATKLSTPTNTGTDGQVVSLTGDKTKWVNSADANALTNNEVRPVVLSGVPVDPFATPNLSIPVGGSIGFPQGESGWVIYARPDKHLELRNGLSQKSFLLKTNGELDTATITHSDVLTMRSGVLSNVINDAATEFQWFAAPMRGNALYLTNIQASNILGVLAPQRIGDGSITTNKLDETVYLLLSASANLNSLTNNDTRDVNLLGNQVTITAFTFNNLTGMGVGGGAATISPYGDIHGRRVSAGTLGFYGDGANITNLVYPPDTITSNGLSARLISTNASLRAYIDAQDSSIISSLTAADNLLSSRIVATNDAIIARYGTAAFSNTSAFVLSPTNSGSDGQVVSLTGNKTKWVDPSGGGGGIPLLNGSGTNTTLYFKQIGWGTNIVFGGFNSNNIIVGDGHNISSFAENNYVFGGVSNRVLTTAGRNTMVGNQYGVLSGSYNTIIGGLSNQTATVVGSGVTILGGVFNALDNNAGSFGLIVGGLHNRIGPYVDASAVLGGITNYSAGSASVTVGGASNVATGDFSLAAGRNSRALHQGTFVWSDGTVFNSTSTNQFLVRASNGMGINTNNPGTNALSVLGTTLSTRFALAQGSIDSWDDVTNYFAQSGGVTYNLADSTNLPYSGLSLDARQSVTNAAVKAAQDATNGISGGANITPFGVSATNTFYVNNTNVITVMTNVGVYNTNQLIISGCPTTAFNVTWYWSATRAGYTNSTVPSASTTAITLKMDGGDFDNLPAITNAGTVLFGAGSALLANGSTSSEWYDGGTVEMVEGMGSAYSEIISYTPKFNGDGSGLGGVLTASSLNGLAVSNLNYSTAFDHDASNTNGTGKPLHANFDKLWRLRMHLAHTNRPLRVTILTDELFFPGSGVFEESLAAMLGLRGGIAGYGGIPGHVANTYSTSPAVFYTPSGNASGLEKEYIYTSAKPCITNGAFINVSRQNGGSAGGIADTNLLLDTISFAWRTDPRGGTFKLQTNINASTWEDSITVNANSATTNLSYTNLTVAKGYYSYRLVGLTGTNVIYAAGGYDNSSNGVIFSSAPINSGPNLLSLTNAYDSILTNWWNYLKPDLLLILDSGTPITGPNSDNTSMTKTRGAIDHLEQVWSNTCPNMDVVHFGWIVYTDIAVAYYNKAVREQAIRYGRAYFDSAYYFPSNEIPLLIARGVLQNDGVHPVQGAGDNYLNTMLWKEMMSDNGIANQYYNRPNITGPGVEFLRGRIPKIWPKLVVQGENGRWMAYNGVIDQQGQIWLGRNDTAFSTDNWNFGGGQNGATYVNSTNGIYIGKGSLYQYHQTVNGGTILGSLFDNVAEPGDGNVRANRQLISIGLNSSTNGYASFTTTSTASIAATGWTNNMGKNATVYVTATSTTITLKNRSDSTLATFTSFTGTIPISLQPGWAITASSGLSGTAVPF